MQIKNFFIGTTLGLFAGISLILTFNRPNCPACPDCNPKLQLQPFNLDANSLSKIKKSKITIHYAPNYSGDVWLSECDSAQKIVR